VVVTQPSSGSDSGSGWRRRWGIEGLVVVGVASAGDVRIWMVSAGASSCSRKTCGPIKRASLVQA
jgi:hypothetical protein